MTGKLKIPSPRTSDGRKIDTWSFQYPHRGGIDIEVRIFVEDGAPVFRATGTDPVVKGKTWSDTDIAALSRRVESDMKEIFERRSGNQWRPSLMVTTRPDRKTDRYGARTLSFELVLSEVTRDIAQDGTSGMRHIVEADWDKHVQETAYGGTALRDTPLGSFRIDTDQSVLLMDDTDDLRADMARLDTTLAGFFEHLSRAMSPAEAKASGIPSPEDLLDMMRRAIGDASS